jgi:hypothetical protein
MAAAAEVVVQCVAGDFAVTLALPGFASHAAVLELLSQAFQQPVYGLKCAGCAARARAAHRRGAARHRP